ncbi:hypothetical protein SAICODRAFT_29670 [Saitoella complicata NRRL Y-17804]|uniref:Uncharacterized protein n=1 Tax=Saitoella complicata (strain BCRC 22490 / CBS 7301 / JCM 7358 / NBRC 10748 / NRRL Y-17804) TaxID=698492 RepID=A0A0E9NHJ5_SAICN|nr:uncharacterized protein SAICODRAFT_29670 [Saitoella complicata NRRL Y-17804]ODQ54081.1 hypothetical protein SAICODRAFT_29670 [Saitoella complicata NRRL Y-17804]GAO49156.1 hypothetical protein G7K_3314-t1 [Saitoella complicata NRRL Y-17804]
MTDDKPDKDFLDAIIDFDWDALADLNRKAASLMRLAVGLPFATASSGPLFTVGDTDATDLTLSNTDANERTPRYTSALDVVVPHWEITLLAPALYVNMLKRGFGFRSGFWGDLQKDLDGLDEHMDSIFGMLGQTFPRFPDFERTLGSAASNEEDGPMMSSWSTSSSSSSSLSSSDQESSEKRVVSTSTSTSRRLQEDGRVRVYTMKRKVFSDGSEETEENDEIVDGRNGSNGNGGGVTSWRFNDDGILSRTSWPPRQ